MLRSFLLKLNGINGTKGLLAALVSAAQGQLLAIGMAIDFRLSPLGIRRLQTNRVDLRGLGTEDGIQLLRYANESCSLRELAQLRCTNIRASGAHAAQDVADG